ncbi:MAG: hypothetical protein JSV97_10370 [candidate division WOR-3 bacterium]|nr:MAG: hypothetical protein JSV97_10370 [candidate division WOR-3 bacterium]
MHRTMKRLLFVTVVILITSGMAQSEVRTVPRETQDETLITGKTRLGFFVAPVMKITELNDNVEAFTGGHAGLIINRNFMIGVGGFGLADDFEYGTARDPLVDFGYGGLLVGYINNSHELIHLSVHSLIGGGGLCYRRWYDVWYDEQYIDAVFVLEPGLDLELNVTRYFRIGLGGSYRLVYGVNFDDLSNYDVSGPAASVTFKLGKF